MALPVLVSGVLKVRGFSRPKDEVAVWVYPPVEFPTRSWPKVGVVEMPVPPPATARVPVSDGVRVKAPAVLVIASAEVRPLVVEVVVPNVIAPVCAVPEVCATEVTPVLVMTPVDELYPIPVPPERDEEDILLLKSVQSDAESAPACEPDAVLMARVPALNVSGEETVVAETTPDAFVERSDESVPVILSVVVVALVASVLVKVCVWFHELAVVVPKARERTLLVFCIG